MTHHDHENLSTAAGLPLARSTTHNSHPRPPSVAPSVVEIAHAIEAATTLDDEPAAASSAGDDNTKIDPSELRENKEAFDVVLKAEVATDPDAVPNGGYGWVVMFCLLGLNLSTWGLNTTYGVFSSYFLEFNYYKATQLDYAWVGGLSASVSMMQGPLANWLARRFGMHLPMLIGALMVGLGQIGAGFCKSFGPFLVCQGLVFGTGMGLILVPSQPLLAHWFDRRLSLAQGLAQAGSGIGALVFSNTSPVLLHSLGVRKTYVIDGCISLAILIPAASLMRGRHKAVGAKNAPLQPKWFWHPGYKYYLVWAFLTMMAYFIFIYTLASYCTNALGFTQVQGGAIQSILAAGQIVGRPLWGYLLDRGGRTNMVILSYLISGVVTLAMWMPGRSFPVMALYGFICGATSGTIHSAVTPLTASIVGLQELGSAMSVYWMNLVVPALVGQPLAIMLVNYSRNTLGRTGPDAYAISIGFCGGLFIAAALVLFGVKHYLQGDWKLWKKS